MLTSDEHALALADHYEEFARPWDIPYICLATLDRREGLLVGLAVNRSEREGHISAAERDVFATFAPHVRAAVRMQMSFEQQGAALLRGVLETLSLPAFLCDASGRVQSLTPAAEAIVASGHTLKIKGGQLAAANDADGRALLGAIEAAARSTDLRISKGETTEAIAAARGVAVATVRAQIKCVLAKLGVKRQVELVARLGQL